MKHARKNRQRLFALLCIGIILVLPLITIIYQATSILGSEIQFIEKKQQGLIQHHALLKLLESLQALRSATFIVRSGDTAMMKRMSSKRESFHVALTAVRFEGETHLQVKWGSIKN